MTPNFNLIKKLYSSLAEKNYRGMAECYHPDAYFEDIAFNLQGKKIISAMWHMIAETDLKASFKDVRADDNSGSAHLNEYTFRPTGRRVVNEIDSTFQFRDGLIIEHRDRCDALKWGCQALGPIKGTMSWLIPSIRRNKAMSVLKEFIAKHPDYA